MANLPYGVAATVLLKSIAELPGARVWVAMVQREVGERLAAGPGSKVYGATSVLAQLACEVRVLRKVPRTVFHPEPNVESALVLLRRRAPAPPPELAALVHAGFAHRRKALAGSLALVPGAPEGLRDATRAALARDRTSAGRPGRAARGRRLAAPRRRDRPRPARRPSPAMSPLASPAIEERAYAKVNLILHVGRRSPGRPAPALLDVRLDRPLRRSRRRGRRARTWSSARGSTAPTSPRPRSGPSAPRVPELPPLWVRIEKRIPVAAGLGGGSADAAAVLRAANRIIGEPLDPSELRALAARLGSDVPSQVEPRHALVAGVGELVEPVELPAFGALLVPQREGLSTAAVYAEVDRLRRRARRAGPRRDALARGRDAAAAGARQRPPARRALAAPRAAPTRSRRSRPRARSAPSSADPGPPASALFEDRGAAEAAAARIEGAIPAALRG